MTTRQFDLSSSNGSCPPCRARSRSSASRSPARRARLVAGCLLLGVFLLLGSCGDNQEVARNVILISIDTLRADRLSCYGYELPTSPFLDSLAAEGTLFERAVAQSPWTLPSHASMITGRFPHRNGVVDESRTLPQDVPTLATFLDTAGFITGAIVNSHWISAEQGLDQGFLTFDSFKETTGNMGRPITENAIAWLQRNGKKPFFLFLHYYDVHSSYTPAPAFRERFTGPYQGHADGSTGQLLAVRAGKLTYSNEDIDHVSDLYDAEIRQLDAELEKLFATIGELGLQETTLVVITADHGEEFLEHGGVLHGRTMYREVLEVPLILRGPGVPVGRRVRDLAMVVDIVPTVLARLGLKPDASEGLDGIDLLGDLDRASRSEGAITGSTRLALAMADWKNDEPDIRRMVQNDRFKLIHNRLTGEAELYDLEHDASEERNLADERPELVQEFLNRLEDLLSGRREADQIAPRSDGEIELLKKLGYF